MKVVPARGTSSADAFVRELSRAMLPVHGNLVQVLDGGIADGCGYLVMQWVDGLDLELVAGLLRLHGRLLPPTLAAFVVAQVLRGLDFLHRLDGGGQAHGNVRASHVLLSISGEVKLAGLGRGKGTPADDMFEVGLLLHELLTGDRSRAPVLRREAVLPRPIDALRLRLLAPDPIDRGTAREALRGLEAWTGYADRTTALAELMQWLTGVEHPRTFEPVASPASPRWPRVLAAVGAVAAIAVGVLAWL